MTLALRWLSATLFCLCLLLPTHSTGAQGDDFDVAIAPPEPTPADSITITVSGWWNNSCTPYYVTHVVTADYITIVTDRDTGICLQIITPWRFDVEIPPLAQGVYEVYVMGAVQGTARFSVVDPATLTNRSYLPLVAR